MVLNVDRINSPTGEFKGSTLTPFKFINLSFDLLKLLLIFYFKELWAS